MVLGIIGEAGSGKTQATNFFQTKGAYIISADLIVKYIYQLPEIKQEIVAKCGEQFLNDDDTINRLGLRKYAFENIQFLTKLEEIIWPKTIKIIIDEVKAHEQEKLIVIDCAVLFNAKIDYLADKILLIEAKEEDKINRIVARDKVSKVEAKTLLDLQKTHLILDQRNDFVIKNDGLLVNFIAQLNAIWEKLVS